MKILIADDDATIRKSITLELQGAGHTVETVENGQQAFYRATSRHYDVLILDYNMPHWDGTKCLTALNTMCPQLRVIVVTGEVMQVVTAKVAGFQNVAAVLSKPHNMAELLKVISDTKPQAYNHIQKLTRIVCTIGPACNNPDTLGEMILAGMDVARLNFSHGDHEGHTLTYKNVRQAEEHWGRPVAILQDLCGPKLRTGKMTNDAIELVKGETIIIQADNILGTSERISTIAPEILGDLRAGDPILLDDGLMELSVISEGTDEVTCRVVVGGTLKNSKGMNLPSSELKLPSVTEKDFRDLEWGIKTGVDFIALSFVRHASDIEQVKAVLDKHESDIKVIAKIEKPEAVDNIEEIIDAADGIMVARGDMGVELPAPIVPWVQKRIIRLCGQKGKPVITATQMLDSMTYNMRPTRAEVTDVTTAVLDGTDAVMLSGETATGIDPVNVVRTMASILRETEMQPEYIDTHKPELHDIDNPEDALILSAALADVTAVMLIDYTGEKVATISKSDRAKRAILVTDTMSIARHSCLYHSVMPIIMPHYEDFKEIVTKALEEARKHGLFKAGDLVAVVGKRGTVREFQREGSLHLMRVASQD